MEDKFEKLLYEAAETWKIGVGPGVVYWLYENRLFKPRQILMVESKYGPKAKFYTSNVDCIYELEMTQEILDNYHGIISERKAREQQKVCEEYFK